MWILAEVNPTGFSKVSAQQTSCIAASLKFATPTRFRVLAVAKKDFQRFPALQMYLVVVSQEVEICQPPNGNGEALHEAGTLEITT